MEIKCAYFVLKNLVEIKSDNSQLINDLIKTNQFQNSLDIDFNKNILKAKSKLGSKSLIAVFKIVNANDVKQDAARESDEVNALQAK